MRPAAALRAASALGMTLAALAACSPPPPPPPPPAPAPEPPPPPPPPEPEVGWHEAPVTPGTWVYRSDARGSVALFGEPDIEAEFVIRCDMPARRITFSRAGELNGGSGTMAFQATHGGKAFAAQNGGDAGHSYIVAATAASDAYLDTIAFSRGRFAVAVTGERLLVLPNWPEPIRVVEDCRG